MLLGSLYGLLNIKNGEHPLILPSIKECSKIKDVCCKLIMDGGVSIYGDIQSLQNLLLNLSSTWLLVGLKI